MNPSTITVKTVFANDIRRFNLSSTEHLSNLKSTICTLYGQQFEFSIRYNDEDGDLVTIASDNELSEAFSLVQQGLVKVMKFYIHPVEDLQVTEAVVAQEKHPDVFLEEELRAFNNLIDDAVHLASSEVEAVVAEQEKHADLENEKLVQDPIDNAVVEEQVKDLDPISNAVVDVQEPLDNTKWAQWQRTWREHVRNMNEASSGKFVEWQEQFRRAANYMTQAFGQAWEQLQRQGASQGANQEASNPRWHQFWQQWGEWWRRQQQFWHQQQQRLQRWRQQRFLQDHPIPVAEPVRLAEPVPIEGLSVDQGAPAAQQLNPQVDQGASSAHPVAQQLNQLSQWLTRQRRESASKKQSTPVSHSSAAVEPSAVEAPVTPVSPEPLLATAKLVSSQVSEWSCSACTFRNKDTKDSCEICGAPHPSESPERNIR